jgi:hypothetical protein
MPSDWLTNPDLLGEEQLMARLHDLREEHRALDGAIAALQAQRPHDQLSIMRLKRQKLSLKDKIAYCEDLLTPDIIA